MPKLTSRSAIESGHCKRNRYNLYHAGGMGYVRSESPVDLFVGTLCHLGVQRLWEGVKEDDAVREVLAKADEQDRYALVRSDGESFPYLDDCKALVELLVRAFSRHGLPELSSEYRLISVEKERPVQLVDDIILETKADALLECRSEYMNKARVVFSLKTTAEYRPWLMHRDRIALQNYTEPYSYDAAGIQMAYLIKGTKGDKFPFQGNPMLYPWHKNGVFSWSWKYFSQATGDYAALGSTWSRVRIWDHMPIKDWMDYVYEKHNAPDRLPVHSPIPWKNVIIVPELQYRHSNEITLVMDSLRVQEKDWFDRLAKVDPKSASSMETHFPREFTQCASPKGTCPYFYMCVYNVLPHEFPSHGYKARTPHHELGVEFDAEILDT